MNRPKPASSYGPSDIWIFLPVLIVLTIGFAVPQKCRGQAQPSLRAFCESLESQYFYGIYLLESKIGWVSVSMRLDQNEHGEVLVAESNGEMQIQLFGDENSLRFSSRSVYSLAGDGPLIHAEESSIDDESKTTSTATAENDGYIVVLESEGQTRRLRTGPSKDNIRSMYNVAQWLKQPRKTGDKRTDYSFDFEKLSVLATGTDLADPDQEETMTFVKSHSARWGGVPVRLAEVKVKMSFITADFEFLPDGTPKTFAFGPMKGRLEEESVAKNVEIVVADMLAFVPIEKDLGPPGKVKSATIELRGLGDFQVPESSRQQVIESKTDYALLDIQAERKPPDSTPIPDAEMTKFTGANLRVQADDKRIISLANKIVGDESDVTKRVERLAGWVFKNLEPSYSKNAETAVRVLQNKAGDCTENALLFVALARSLKIPAREVSGLIFFNDTKPGFHWHAWAEVYDGNHWIGVDPAFNQVDIDAAHIKLGTQSGDWKCVEILGKLKIRIRDFETAD